MHFGKEWSFHAVKWKEDEEMLPLILKYFMTTWKQNAQENIWSYEGWSLGNLKYYITKNFHTYTGCLLLLEWNPGLQHYSGLEIVQKRNKEFWWEN